VKEISSTMLMNGGAIVKNGNSMVQAALYETQLHESDRSGMTIANLKKLQLKKSLWCFGAIDYRLLIADCFTKRWMLTNRTSGSKERQFVARASRR